MRIQGASVSTAAGDHRPSVAFHDRLSLLTEKLLEHSDQDEDDSLSRLLVSLFAEQGPGRQRAAGSLYAEERILNGVVRIFCTHSSPNFHMPWQRQKQEYSTSSGFVISGRRILTNAHAIEYGALIQVKTRQSEQKYVANVVAVGHECDLAVLEIDDDAFWHDVEELSFGELPQLLEDVAVAGYPVGGDSLSITSGIVSRIEMQEYAQASADLLAIQIDAAINPGNSGGPVFNARHEVIGVAFQSLTSDDTENIGYVVPVSVIQHFLQTIDRSIQSSKTDSPRYAVCSLGCQFQSLESPALRRFLQMTDCDTGVRVAAIEPLAPAQASLRVNDVLLRIDGVPVGNDGTIPFREGNARHERVHVNYACTQKFVGDSVHLQVLRDGQRFNLSVLVWVRESLIPRNLLMPPAASAYASAATASLALGRTPSYVIVGGLVFMTLTREYIESEFKLKHMAELDSWREEFALLALAGASRRVPHEEIVVLSEVLAHPCNVGYETYRNLRVVACNGQPVLNLHQLRAMVEAALEDLPLDDDAAGGRLSSAASSSSALLSFTCHGGAMVVLDVAQVRRAQRQICQEHFIPSPYSPDLLEQRPQP